MLAESLYTTITPHTRDIRSRAHALIFTLLARKCDHAVRDRLISLCRSLALRPPHLLILYNQFASRIENGFPPFRFSDYSLVVIFDVILVSLARLLRYSLLHQVCVRLSVKIMLSILE